MRFLPHLSYRFAVNAVVLLALPTVACAQEPKSRRLESVTWNPAEHKLTWVVTLGSRDGAGKFAAVKKETYNINMADATMMFNGDTRRFSQQEAKNVHMLMDLVAKYAIESTVWWDQGQGEPLGGSEKVKSEQKRDNPEPGIGRKTPRRNSTPTSSPGIVRIGYEPGAPR